MGRNPHLSRKRYRQTHTEINNPPTPYRYTATLLLGGYGKQRRYDRISFCVLKIGDFLAKDKAKRFPLIYVLIEN